MSYLARTSRTIRTTLPTQYRTFALSSRRMAAGDTGATRSGGVAQGDSFSKREEASENLYIKQQEQEKLKQLREKIKAGETQLAQDKKDLEDLGKK